MAKCSCCIPCSCYHFISYIGALLILLGILIAALQSSIINIGLKAQLEIVPGTTAYDLWLKPDPQKAPLYLSVWIWNIDNADEYKFTPGSGIRDPASWTFPKARVSQIGPFVYEEQFYKTNVTYFDDNGVEQNDTSKSNRKNLLRVQSNQRYSYKSVYDPNDPSTGLDPNIETVNVGNLLTIALPNIVEYIISTQNLDRGKQVILRNLINGVLKNSQTLPVLKGLTAHEALFNYEDPVLKELKEECLQLEACKDTIIAELPDHFGFLLEKATKLGWPFYEQNTGVDDINKYGFIERFKSKESEEYSSKLDFWDLPGTCNDIAGTDGSSVQPHLKKDNIVVFSPDVYRTLYGNYTGEDKSQHYGLTLYEFTTLEEVFAAPIINPANSCFCDPTFFVDKPTDVNCTEISGGIIPFKANSGIPLLVSLPQFVYGEQLFEYVEGDFDTTHSDDYQSKFYFEPVSGSIVQAKKRLQQSLIVTQDKNYPMLKEMPQTTLVIPMVWINESVVISEELEKELYDGVVVGTNIILGLWIGSISLGLVLLIVGCCCIKKNKKEGK